MKIIEYGQDNPEVVVLLHGGGLSWWNYRETAELLAREYHVVLPVLDGHGGSDVPFTTIEDNAQRLLEWIDDRFGGQVLALGGLSLGGQVAAELLARRHDICRCALLESVLVKPMKLTHALIGPVFGMSYGLVRQRWFSRLQAAYLGIPRRLFEDYYRDTCAISGADMSAFLKANSAYLPKPGLAETTARVKLVAGAREQRSIRDSAKLLGELIPGSSMELLPGLRHGDLSINHPEAYAKMLSNWIRRKKYDPA